ncbi:TetR/AcrR family transcriptional regulator [Pseudoclavibacter sp. 13-3]|uniref:TetR/AcrR family transcriptional regulator n=1 Tax=Pseudoclavibacter sp. 13-3 TaxID=2901228 RepID=UPI001E35F0D4|nr:TetR family transcriptional regulator [Pseudoclavibacter sp. 13-3]MCD7101630.1 TetR/AcrR family transcriptional regulator [Pseudoclavibacter sp. 13-3]
MSVSSSLGSVPAPGSGQRELSRRELNRAATRAAIIEAAISLVLEHGRDRVNVEQIAERAAVSRRTFFNYFPGIDAALNAPTEDLLVEALQQIENRPAAESVVEAVTQVFMSSVTSRYLQQCLELGAALDGHAEFLQYELMAWDEAEARFVTALQQRAPVGMPRIRLVVFVASVLASCRAAINAWLAERHQPADGIDAAPESAALTDADLTDLKRQLLNAVVTVRDGFADL